MKNIAQGFLLSLLVLVIPSVSVGQLSQAIIGPHLTLGYQYQTTSFFNAGIALPITNEDDTKAYKFKPNISLGDDTIVGLGAEYVLSNILSEDDSSSDAAPFLLLTVIGLQPRYDLSVDSFGLDTYVNFNLFYFDFEVGYSFLGEDESVLHNQWRFGANIRLFPGIFK